MKYLHTKGQTVFNDFELEDIVNFIINQTIERNANFIQDRSGLVVHKVNSTVLHIARQEPLAAASHHTDLPKSILDKHAVINVQNEDDRCFGYSVLSMLLPNQQNAHRPTLYNHFFEHYHLDQLNYPIAPRNVPEIENALQMTISIYGHSHAGLKRFPIYLSKKQFPIQIDLLYWDEHFAWIKDFPALFFDVNKHESRKWFCHNCLGHFQTQQAIDNHHRNCQMAGFMSTIYTMPHPGAILKFKNVRYQQKQVFKVFADCESLIEPANAENDNPLYRRHIPCAVGFKFFESSHRISNPI